MGSPLHDLKVMFLPYFTPSHIIPLVDIARLFAKRGVNVTIVTTPSNALLFQSSVNRDIAAGHPISVHTLKFPAAEVGLPEGIENFHAITSIDMSSKVYAAIILLQDPMEHLIRDTRPDCIVSDMFFPWTVNIADELHIPRIVLTPSNFFFHCITHSLKIYAPHEEVKSETESFVIPGLPDKIEITRSQLPDHVKTKTRYGQLMEVIRESDSKPIHNKLRGAVCIKKMATTQPPTILLPNLSSQPILEPPMTQPSETSPRTPFSAVAPARLIVVPRLHVHVTLDTIYEEETTSHEYINTVLGSSMAFLSMESPCFLQVQKTLASSSSYSHNCRCA